MAVLATDDFNRANNADLGAAWTPMSGIGPFRIVSNQCVPTTAGANAFESYSGITWPDDHYSQARITTAGTTAAQGPGLLVRASPSALTTYHLSLSHAAASNIRLTKFVAGTPTGLVSFTQTWTDGDLFRFEVQGTTLRVFLNGSQVGTDWTDSSIASGRPGLCYNSGPTCTLDDWEGGDFAAASSDLAVTLTGSGSLGADLTTEILLASTLAGAGTLAAELTTGSPGVPPTYVGNGVLATNITVAAMNVIAPTGLQNNDILIACLINKALGNAISPPDGTWTEIIQGDNDCAVANDDHRYAMFWKRAASTDSGASFTFTKAVDDNLLFAGTISAWRGCVATGSPIDPATLNVNVATAAASTVTLNSYDPLGTSGLIVAVCFYANDGTNFTLTPPTGTNPTFTNRWDLETSTGTDATIAGASGTNDGTATGSRTWASNAGVTSGYTSVMFALISVVVGGTVFEVTVSGTLTSSGALVRQATKGYVSTLPMSGSFARQLSMIRTLTGTVPSSGALARAPAKRVVGILNLSGALGPRGLFKVLSGTVPMAGALAQQRQQTQVFAGTMPSAGVVIKVATKFMKSNIGVVRRLPMSAFLIRQPIKVVAGTVPMTGTVKSSPQIRQFAGVLGSTGTLQLIRSQTMTFSGAVLMAGTLTWLLSHPFSGLMASAGALKLTNSRAFSGVIASLGTLRAQVALRLAGTVPSTGTVQMIRSQTVTLSGTVAIAGTVTGLLSRTFSGLLASAGSLKLTSSRVFSGVIASLGALRVQVALRLAGTLPSTGTMELAQDQEITLTGTITPVSELRLQSSRPFSGLMASAGSLKLTSSRVFSGVIAFLGGLRVQVAFRLAGTVPSTGTVELVQGQVLNLAGTVTPVSDLRLQSSLDLSGSVGSDGWLDLQPDVEFQGSIGLEGTLNVGTDVQLSGSLGLDGSLEMVGDRIVDVGGTIPMTGSTAVARLIAFSGVLALTSTLRRRPSKMFRSMVLFVGETTTGGFVKSLAGTLSMTSTLTRQVTRRVISALMPVGKLVKQVHKRLNGVTAFVGEVTLLGVNVLALTGIIVPSGVLAAPLLARAFAGTISFAGTLILLPAFLVRLGTIKMINAILRFAGVTSPKLTGHGKPKDTTLGGHSTLDDSELR